MERRATEERLKMMSNSSQRSGVSVVGERE
jgi:hypothetical protein